MKKLLLLVLLFISFAVRPQCYSSITSKGYHNLAIKSDGTLWAWGRNNYGQIGDNTTTNRTSPVQIGSDTDWSTVSTGTYHSLAVKDNGTLWAWGNNSDGETGNGGPHTPQMFGTETDWALAAGGLAFSAAIKSNGTLWMWGANTYGQLGDGTTVNHSTPAQVGNDSDWVSVYCGSQHVLALKANGTLWAWGWNNSGQLGIGNTNDQHLPVQVGTATDWVKIYTAYSVSYAIKADGSLWVWGYNNLGSVGDGTTTNRTSPVQIGTSTWKNIAGVYQSIGVKTDGTLWAWGRNMYGEVGNGNTTNQLTPVQIGTDDDWIKAAPGFYHSLALKGNGTLWSWGDNEYGQLGNNSTINQLTPIQSGSICDEPYCSINATALPDITAQCSVAYEDITPPVITDNCDNEITPELYSGTFPITGQGTTTISWEYMNDVDDIIITQNVVIEDTEAPVPDTETLPELIAQCALTAGEVTAPTATDNCAGEITATTNTVFPVTAQGITTITWTYNDGHGNTATQTQNVTISDTEAPVPDLATLPDVMAQCEVTGLTPPTATDNCSGSLTATTDAVFPITVQGTTTVTWTYNDNHGNTATQTQNVVIEDTQAPLPDANSLPSLTAQCEFTADSLVYPTATDNCSGVITATTDAVFPITGQGTTSITWAYTDANGNTATQTQNVVIEDTQAPVPDVASLSDLTAQCEFIQENLSYPTATDNCSGAITATTNAVFPITGQGTTVITWTYTDVNGNTATQTQDVIIQDTEAPVVVLQNITLPIEEDGTVILNAQDMDNGSFDTCGTLAFSAVPSSFTCDDLGNQQVTVTVSDGNGNSSNGTATVTITDPNNYCQVSAVAAHNDKKPIIYPNPARNMLYLQMPEGTVIKSVKVFSVTGQELKVIFSDSGNGLSTIALNGLSGGTYFLNVETDKGNFTEKFIKS